MEERLVTCGINDYWPSVLAAHGHSRRAEDSIGPVKAVIVGDAEAAKLTAKEYRAPWKLPQV